mmetsp:Transcript_92797/g.198996  ORF Transcript_92797/g.198996 Transcript_92797/m.198996 type:complete len:151 (+) Transcript_92797:135-587(+)
MSAHGCATLGEPPSCATPTVTPSSSARRRLRFMRLAASHASDLSSSGATPLCATSTTSQCSVARLRRLRYVNKLQKLRDTPDKPDRDINSGGDLSSTYGQFTSTTSTSCADLHPLDFLTSEDVDALRQTRFLSDEQISHLNDYLDRHGTA